MLAVVSAGIAPGIALLFYFYLKDKYDTEPIGMVVKTFIFGALIVFPVMVIQYAFKSEGVLQGLFSNAFILTGLLEEFFKWFIIIYTAYHHAAFNERYDGIIYAVAVSLGFATVENIFYLTAYGINYALIRALLPVSSHALFGVIMGYYIGKAKFSKKKKTNLLTGLMTAALLHGLYDLILHIESVWLYIIIPFMIYLWWNALRKVKMAHSQHQSWLKTHSNKMLHKENG
ncbi:RsiW-degrading membrane proteinase PrsW (M82 family) [Scopulibacillus darangshiensis]|uniref:Protease PrsW n=1 Tax=Scopulibacillus darangshiensis TaxID=442528 RepID=A0A4R2PCL5_9BACL|nr:glutamic-type intramembrane protease PrsW [Scopulibacillus darangshiensis]TCP31665.1 RsiW-degrading membrane proteinase PrsW (M82 family) [Scopulibacillus darangshiensis]